MRLIFHPLLELQVAEIPEAKDNPYSKLGVGTAHTCPKRLVRKEDHQESSKFPRRKLIKCLLMIPVTTNHGDLISKKNSLPTFPFISAHQ